MTINEAINVIDDVPGFFDNTSSAGEAWSVVKERLEMLERGVKDKGAISLCTADSDVECPYRN